jgi:hypothetical protein
LRVVRRVATGRRVASTRDLVFIDPSNHAEVAVPKELIGDGPI